MLQSENIMQSANTLSAGFIMLITILALCVFSAEAQTSPPGAIEIEPGGQIWIEGSASIVNYKCNAEELSGNGEIQDRQNPQQSVKQHGDVSIAISVPVKTLECGKKRMNKDMFEALKADQHPYITYKLLSASQVDEYISKEDSTRWMKIKTRGLITIAGVTDTADVVIDGLVVEKDRFRVKGVKSINMHNFNIKPPQALLGLIKADEEIEVHFDVTVRLKDT